MSATATARRVVVETGASPYARLRPVPIDAVTIDDAFWAPRRRQNVAATIPAQGRQLWATGRIANFLRVTGKHDGPFQGMYFNDSDVYKWLEAASWVLAGEDDPALAAQVDDVIAIVAAAQQPDGYLNTYFALERAGERWTNSDLHEMYCAGHLFQAAVAHHRATGSAALLDVATRFADHIDRVFGPAEQGKRRATDGHPEVEMGLVELYRETGERRYLELARFLVDVRGHGLLGNAYGRFGSAYHQDHRPFRELDEIVGHAVRAVYLNAGVADLYAETGEPAWLDALHRLWASMTERKMYVGGGIGARYEGEAFGDDYELPNRRAYAETCAAIGSAMWSWRMLLIEGEARYADLVELQLANAMLAGIALDGETFFYQNPLEDDGGHRRSPWFHVACCPPNVARTLAALPGYLYATAGDELWVHLYAAGSAAIELEDGTVVRLRQRTDYPWSGEIALEVETGGAFGLRLRVPGWVEPGAARLTVNGEAAEGELRPGSYALMRRDWRPGDRVHLTLPMPVRRVACHPAVTENVGKVALMHGPLLYCLEETDNPGVDLRDVRVIPDAAWTSEHRPDLLGGVTVLTGRGETSDVDPAWGAALYCPFVEMTDAETRRTVPLTAIPYYAWANREPGRMRVWLPVNNGHVS